MCRLLLLIITDVVTCKAQVRSARKTFHSHGSGGGLIFAVFCNVDARTVRCTDAAAGSVTTTVQQLVQLQHAQQAAAGTVSPSNPEQAGLRSAKIFDLRHLKFTTFDGTPSKYDDWVFSFKRGFASNCDAHKMLVYVERATDEFREEGQRMESVSAELYDLLCSCIRVV